MHDYELTNQALEERVAKAFRTLGCTAVIEPRGKKEDVLVEPPTGWKPEQPIAIEAKGKTRNENIKTEDLRQLDDWIFELSGEMDIRYRTLTNWRNPLLRKRYIGPPHLGNVIYETPGAIPYSPVHPNPVKGVIIFNGPTYKPFEDRDADWFPHNEREFAVKRSFCVMTLEQLLRWVQFCSQNEDLKKRFWQLLHDTFGQCPDPPNESLD